MRQLPAQTAHLFEYPSADFGNMALCEVCETPREISVEVRDQLPIGYGVKLTTTASLPGHEIVDVLDVISAEYAVALTLLGELATGAREIVGGQGIGLKDGLRQARRHCLAELRREAGELGADAVIGVHLHHTQVGGALLLVATGTAVRVTASAAASDDQ